MKNEFLEKINKYDTGLIPYNLPTGYGKSYWTINTMCEYAFKHSGKKLFYITPQKKNLDINKFKEIYEKHGKLEDFKNDVLVLKSNFDCVVDAYNNTDVFDENNTEIPSSILKREEYRNMIQELKKLNLHLDWNYRKLVEEDLRTKHEPKFRAIIHDYLIRNENHKIRKIMATKDPKYDWLRKIYPHIAFDEAKIVLLTSKKLVSKLDLIYQSSIDTMDKTIINNAVLFLDEFDSIKQDMTDSLIENSLNYQTDILYMFLNIHDRLNNHEISTEYKKYVEINIREYNSIIVEMNSIFNEFNLTCNYKTKDVKKNEKNFIFNDFLTTFILQNKKSHILILKKPNINTIRLVNKEEYDKNIEEEISIFQLLRRINKCLFELSNFIKKIAEKRYAEKIEQEKEDGVNLENIIASIYDDFGADKETKKFMINNNLRNIKIYSLSKLYERTFYNRGLNFYRFIDNDSHEHRTKFQYYNYRNTPEKILLYLCNRNLVFGMSATANVKSVISNFDMIYIKEKLGDKLYSPSNRKEVVGYLDDIKKSYEKQVKINTKIITAEGSMKEQFKELFGYKSKEFLALTTVDTKDNDYNQKRYLKIFKVMKEFIDSDLQSFLCVNNVLAKQAPEFSKEIFEKAFKKLASKTKAKLVFLDSNNFEYNKTNLLNRLSNNEKIFVMTAYATIGKGQNLTYSIDSLNKDNLVVLKDVDDDRTKEKDFDGIFLGEITNVIPSTIINNPEKSIYNLLIVLESLYERGEVQTYTDLQKNIKAVFNNDMRALSFIRNTDSFKNYLTHEIIQTVGRLNRTFVKNKEIRILLDERLIGNVGLDIEEDLSTPEVNAVFDVLSNYDSKKETDQELKVLLDNQKKCNQSVGMINNFLEDEWDEHKIREWSKLRESVLKHPTTNDLSVIELIKKNKINYYMTSNTPINKYYYYQHHNRAAISISFKSKEDLRKQINSHGAIIIEASMQNCSLDIIMKNEAIKQMFKSSGYATTFVPGKYMISPVIYNNIYKGALGEVVGRFILETNLNIKLEELEKEHYEYFDNKYHNYYFDFKHWNVNTTFKETEMLKKIDRKLSSIGGNAKGIIINLINRGDNYINTNYRNILVIPCLINQDGSLNITNLHQIGGFINENNHE